MIIYKNNTPGGILIGNHDMPTIYKGENLLCSPTFNYEPYKKMTNLVANGDFSDGMTGWNVYGATLSVADNTGILTGNGTLNYPYLERALPSSIIGHVYGATIRFRVTTADCLRLVFQYGNGADLNPTEKVINPVQNTWYQRTFVYTAINATTRLAIAHMYASAAASNGKVMEVQYVSCIDLTEAFGAGSEINETAMTEYMLQFENNWFEGSKFY